MFELDCCSWDYYEYNYIGPKNNRYGCRMFVEMSIDSVGIKQITIDIDLQQFLICSPAGRVIKSGKCLKDISISFNAKIPGTYLLKLWGMDMAPDFFKIKFVGLTTAKVKIWSKLVSNKDGSLFQGNTNKDMRTDVSKCYCNTRSDRRTHDFR